MKILVLNYFKKSYYKAFSGIASWMKMLSENWRVEHVNIYVYIFVYMYICIYINIYIYRRANGIYIQKSCSIWTVCPCFFFFFIPMSTSYEHPPEGEEGVEHLPKQLRRDLWLNHIFFFPWSFSFSCVKMKPWYFFWAGEFWSSKSETT